MKKFTNTFLVRIGGSSLSIGDEVYISKYDYVFLERFHYNDINGNSWTAIKNLNPNIKIMNYQMGFSTNDNQDALSALYLNTISRWNTSRSHSMGNLNIDNTNLYLTKDNIRISDGAVAWLMDVGVYSYREYWCEATITDIIGQLWESDGIFIDGCPSVLFGWKMLQPDKYPTDLTWGNASNGYVNYISNRFKPYNQLIGCNRGGTIFTNGDTIWNELDNKNNFSTPPDFSLEEGTFVVWWGGWDAQVFSPTEWKNSVDVIASVTNYKCFIETHIKIDINSSGIDNYGKSFTGYDMLYYALASFHIGSKENSYFTFMAHNPASYNIVFWFDEYDYINLGESKGTYTTQIVSGTTIYKREFDNGYVYVNPSLIDVTGITLSKPGKNITHSNLYDIKSIPLSSSIDLQSHRGAFILYDRLPINKLRLNRINIV